MMPVHGRPARELGKPDSEVAEGSWVDSNRNGGAGRDRPELSGGCRAGQKECFDPQSGTHCEGIQGLAVAAIFEALGRGISVGVEGENLGGRMSGLIPRQKRGSHTSGESPLLTQVELYAALKAAGAELPRDPEAFWLWLHRAKTRGCSTCRKRGLKSWGTSRLSRHFSDPRPLWQMKLCFGAPPRTTMSLTEASLPSRDTPPSPQTLIYAIFRSCSAQDLTGLSG
jgi:hypothetical protein